MNTITIVGNVGSDPELKYTKTGKPLVTMSIASTRKVKVKLKPHGIMLSVGQNLLKMWQHRS
jgi:single-stranded DNA-binding protein